MEQRTCNIIMCCKGHCNIGGRMNMNCLESIAAYMSKECACPEKDYKGELMETILREALFDYFKTADRPSSDLRNLLQQYYTRNPDLSERIYTMFQLVDVRKDDGAYSNGFTAKLINQSEIDLETINNEK